MVTGIRRHLTWLLTVIVICLGIVGCSSSPVIKMDPEVIHKKDLEFCVNGVACFKGAGVVPRSHQYQLEIAPRKEENIERIVFSTCHQTKPFYMEELPIVDLPFFASIFGKKKRGIRWDYIPDPVLEASGDCDLYIYALDFESEDHSWAVMRTQHPKYQLPARITCDGDQGRDSQGVSVCDGRVGTYQRIKFDVPVQFFVPDECPKPIRLDSGEYKIKLAKGKCPYLVRSQEGESHSLLLFGWEHFKFQKR